MDTQKEKQAIKWLQLMGGGERDPYYLAYSGGKDSDAIYTLAKLENAIGGSVYELWANKLGRIPSRKV